MIILQEIEQCVLVVNENPTKSNINKHYNTEYIDFFPV